MRTCILGGLKCSLIFIKNLVLKFLICLCITCKSLSKSDIVNIFIRKKILNRQHCLFSEIGEMVIIIFARGLVVGSEEWL